MIKIKKAQLAVETLLIYGLVILIVMIAIGTLWGTGYLNFDMFIGDSCKISSELNCGEYVVRAENADPNQVQLEIENIYGNNVQINELFLEGVDDTEGLFTRCGSSDLAEVIPNGDRKTFSFTGCGDLSSFVGKKVKASIEVNWNRVGREINRTAHGELRATVAE